jgi:hypothetical protein
VADQAQADGMARRDAHAKAHATLQATFQMGGAWRSSSWVWRAAPPPHRIFC